MDLTNRVDQLLGQMRAAQSLASKLGKTASEEAAGPATDFAQVLKTSIEQVNRDECGARP